MKRLFLMMVLMPALLIFLGGCSTEEPGRKDGVFVPGPFMSTGSAVTVVEGEQGTGSVYALFSPADWNGDLVVYAHGYVFPFEAVSLPDVDGLRDAWLAMGYGVAYSSYSETGYAIKEAVANTRQLRGLFAANFGMPSNTFLVGHSMGGLISVMLAERNPALYAGALPMCGIVGGSDMTIDYVYDVRVLFDYFYPGVLPGNAQYVPEGTNPFALADLVVATILYNPLPAVELAGVQQVSIQYADFGELIDAIVTAIVFHAGSWADVFDRTHRHNFYDNTGVYYTGSSDDNALNSGVDRFESTPDAVAYLDHWYEPRGELKIPVVTLHTSRDQLVQVFQEGRYADIVAAAGNSDMLSQHVIDRFGHCAFTLEEQLDAFNELVGWSASMEKVSRANRK
jgi:pimeloyl-ACP methyl ester carboxylesterase